MVMALVGVCCAVSSATILANEITTGRVFGRAPAGATVRVSSPEIGIQRTIHANAKGFYRLGWVPVGVYTVTAVDNGQPLAMHSRVQVFVDTGSRVDFSCAYGRCSELAAD
jgi:acyl-CoA reductase-like NAD-dependent aldehyde dehydrogenase